MNVRPFPTQSTPSAASTGLLEAQLLRQKQVRESAQTWVGQTFFGEMLKQMRKSPWKSELFGGGRGGEVFNEMLDGILAQRMSKGAGGKLVDAIVKKVDRLTTQALARASARKVASGATVRAPSLNLLR